MSPAPGQGEYIHMADFRPTMANRPPSTRRPSPGIVEPRVLRRSGDPREQGVLQSGLLRAEMPGAPGAEDLISAGSQQCGHPHSRLCSERRTKSLVPALMEVEAIRHLGVVSVLWAPTHHTIITERRIKRDPMLRQTIK